MVYSDFIAEGDDEVYVEDIDADNRYYFHHQVNHIELLLIYERMWHKAYQESYHIQVYKIRNEIHRKCNPNVC